MNESANKIKTFVLNQLQKSKSLNTNDTLNSVSDELLKLANLKNQGILSEDEFQSEKKKLLGL
jgi:hypothetical protein